MKYKKGNKDDIGKAEKAETKKSCQKTKRNNRRSEKESPEMATRLGMVIAAQSAIDSGRSILPSDSISI